MIQERHRATTLLYFTVDLVALLVAFFTAWYLRFEFQIVPLTKTAPDFDRYLQLLPFIVVLWPLVFYFHGLYQPRRSRSQVEDSATMLVATLLSTILLSGLMAWVRPAREPGSLEYFTYSRAFLGVFAAGGLVLTIAGRHAVRAFLRRFRRRGHNLQRILVIGAGALGQEISRKIHEHRELGFDLVGFLDDDPSKQGSVFHGAPVLGPLDSLEAMLDGQRIDQAFLALPLGAHQKTLQMLQILGREAVDVKIVPDVLQYATLQATLEDLDGTPVINLSQAPLQGWSSLIKRSIDFVFATAGMLLLAPALPLVALAIWLEDRGPIFYSQERMGLDGRPFHILKLRSMRANAESSTGPIWAVKDDPRRTVIGGFLRKWSIDELPQLWNVVKGDMSLVGPRPERPSFVHEFKHKVPQYMLRHKVKAGITGWAQVHGWRGNTSIRKRIEYDLYYIENWSLALDFKILWMTLRHGIRPENAY